MDRPDPSQFESDAASDHRNALRKPVRMRARLREGTAWRAEIDVLDLSPTGLRAESSHQLRPGAVVSLTLPGFSSIEAVVAWQRGVEIGCSFRTPLHPAVFDHITALANR